MTREHYFVLPAFRGLPLFLRGYLCLPSFMPFLLPSFLPSVLPSFRPLGKSRCLFSAFGSLPTLLLQARKKGRISNTQKWPILLRGLLLSQQGCWQAVSIQLACICMPGLCSERAETTHNTNSVRQRSRPSPGLLKDTTKTAGLETGKLAHASVMSKMVT